MTTTESIESNDRPPALWNPNAASNWCLIFGPVFGSALHHLNWKALGHVKEANAALIWFAISISAMCLMPLFRFVPLIVLITWYFASARKQIKYVAARFGKDYPRQSWTKPLCFGAVGIFAFGLILEIGGHEAWSVFLAPAVVTIFFALRVHRRSAADAAKSVPVTLSQPEPTRPAPAIDHMAVAKANSRQTREEAPAYSGTLGECPNCSAQIPMTSEQCTRCGAVFSDGGWRVKPPPVYSKTLGTCPNCDAQMPLAALECPQCKVVFSEGSAWTVQPLDLRALH